MNAGTQPQTTSRIDCLCGCGQPTSPKANYRPGHDAAHVSALLADLIAHGDLSNAASQLYIKALPSIGLQIKLEKAIDRYTAKMAAKKAPKAAKATNEMNPMLGHVARIGRWDYPVAEGSVDGKVYRNVKRDGTGPWVLADPKDVKDA